jgi:DNA-binding response OmpR family regulator
MQLTFVIIGDQPTASAGAIRAMESLGHSVTICSRLTEALASQVATDAIVLDATSQATGSEQHCRLLAELDSGRPIVAIVSEESVGHLSGAWGVSDFVLSTAGPVELLVRITLARNRHQGTPAHGQRVGPYVLNHDEMTIRVGSADIALTRAEHAVLALFFDHPDTVFSRADLRQLCWSDREDMSPRAIDTFICRLRQKLGSHGPSIATVRNVGYRLTVALGDPGEIACGEIATGAEPTRPRRTNVRFAA